jgi:hypothetical protein
VADNVLVSEGRHGPDDPRHHAFVGAAGLILGPPEGSSLKVVRGFQFASPGILPATGIRPRIVRTVERI